RARRVPARRRLPQRSCRPGGRRHPRLLRGGRHERLRSRHGDRRRAVRAGPGVESAGPSHPVLRDSAAMLRQLARLTRPIPATGESFWHARALVGVSHAWLTFADERARDAVLSGLDHAVSKPAPADVRALHILTARRLIADAGVTSLRSAMLGWVQELAACRDGDVLKNNDEEVGSPHLWAHIQEGVLAWSSSLLEEPELLDVAARSLEALVVPAVDARFEATSTSPYDVASCIYSLDRL